MTEEPRPFEVEDRSGVPDPLPIFALPNVVLFPHAVLPLHIFEERYRRMIAASLGGSGLLGIFLLQPGWARGEAPRPYPVGGLAQITRAVRLPGGTFDILCRGLAKVRIRGPLADAPYPRAPVAIVEDLSVDADAEAALARQLVEAVRRAAALRRAEVAGLLPQLTLLASPRDLAYFVAAGYPDFDPHARQRLLERDAVAEQLRGLLSLLSRDVAPLN